MLILESPIALKDYCLRKLGAPVINIELDDTQIMDRIDDTIDKFILNHYNGTTEVYKIHTITQTEVDLGYIIPASNLMSILEVLDVGLGSGSSVEAFQRLDYRIAQSDMFNNIANIEVTEYVMKMQHLSMFKQIFKPNRSFQYNPVKKYLMVSDKLIVGNKIILHGYESINPDQHINVYNDAWVKKYATAQIKMQWGNNIKKYDDVQLPGGVSMNGQKIYDEALAEIEQLDQEFSLKYELPVDMMFGGGYF